MDIAAWLRDLRLAQYVEAFRANDIDADVLAELTADDLRDLGVASVGHRRRLLAAIAALRDGDVAPADDDAPAAGKPAEQPFPTSPEAERRQLTVMFADLVGSTELAGRLDPEDLGDVIRAYQDACAGAIARYEGVVAKFMGDGILAYFGFPRAYEDAAERAVHAALGIVAAVGHLQTPDGAPLAVRVGIATGLVVVGELVGEGPAQEQAVLGETPNLAARLQSLGGPNDVIISRRTRRLVGGLFELHDLGPQRLKGFVDSEEAWRVLGPSAAEGRFEALHAAELTPFVGREEEIGLLLRRWEQAGEGEGQLVLLCGEPGIGKSRVVRALREILRGEPHTRLSYHCSPHHTNTVLHPVIQQLERAAGLIRGEPPAQQLEKIEALLGRAAAHAAEIAPLVADLLLIPSGGRYPPLSVSPQRRKEMTLDALVAQLEGLAAEQPVLMVFEDVHWIDPTSKELLERIVEQVPSWRVLLIITARPEFASPWTGAAHVTTLSLNRLSRRQGTTLVDRITGGKSLPEEVLDQILAKTDGIPLFVEELTKTVLESGLLREEGGRYVLSGPLPPLAIPATLRDSLMARLDRLATVREVAQIGAAIGREFSYELLSAVSSLGDNELVDALGQLIRAELIFHRGTPPRATYAFKHALIQDTAHESLLRHKRQTLHARIARVLMERSTDTPEPEVLAHHLTEANLLDEAITYWQRAGQRAAERSAGAEATAHLTKALELTNRLPEGQERAGRELSLQIAFAPVLMLTKGFGAPEVQRAYVRARDLCREVGDPVQLFTVTFGLWHVHQNRGELRTARALTDEVLALARAQGDPAFRLQAHHAGWTTDFHLGDQTACHDHAEQGRALYDPEAHRSHKFVYGGHDPGVCSRNHAALSSWLLGYPDRALALSGEAIRLAQDLGHPMSLLLAHCFTSFLHQFRHEPQRTFERAEATVAICAEQGIAPHYVATGRIMRGWATAAMGKADEGAAEMREGLADLLVTEMSARRPYYLAMLAEAESWAGQAGRGLAALEEARDLVERTGERRWAAEIDRLRGELILARGAAAAEAEHSFRSALRTAGEQRARSLELRAACSLARILAEQGDDRAARDLLSPVYGRFTEGFDTPDLKDAKTLLDTPD